MQVTVALVNSFTLDGQGGNPAGVVFNAEQLSAAQKLKIAQAVGYSETAFVCADDESSDVDFCVSFFTTTGEVDFCGHATLAVFSTLYQMEKISIGVYRQRTKAGILAVSVEAGGRVIMEQQRPKKLAEFSYREIAGLLGIDEQLLASTQLPIEVISTGLADLIIPVPIGMLDAIQANNDLIADFCKQHQIVGFHLFELAKEESRFNASCRNFAPLVGIPEESATGSSCGALACYLSEHLDLGGDYVFEQGRAMQCTSMINASVESNGGVVTAVKVGGVANQFGTIDISIP